MDKAIYSITELSALGYGDKDIILQWCHIPGQTFAYRNPGGRKWRIDMRKFEKWLNAHCERR